MGTTDASSQPGTGWDEAQCRTALAQLEGLQEQLDGLRLSIHRVLQPLSAPHTDKAVLFPSFKQATVGSQNDIKAFRAHWQSEGAQSIFQHGKESLKANSDLSASSQVPRYGWRQQSEIAERTTARRRKDDLHTLGDETVAIPHDDSVLQNDEIARLVDDFQKAHPQIKVGTKDDNRDLMCQFVAGDLNLRFHVVINLDANGRDKLSAECLGMTKPFSTISRCVSSRPRANDLKYLLDMIAAYKTVKGTSCAKCNKMLDNTAQIPTARRSKQTTSENGATETVWEAFHASCLD